MLTACVEVAKRFHAAETEFGKFVLNLRHDMKAVEALELPWTTSPAEGQINRLKIKANHVWQGRLQAAPRAYCLHRNLVDSTQFAGEPTFNRH